MARSCGDVCGAVQLLLRAKNGDHNAFEELVRPEIAPLYGLAGLVLSDRIQAEEAVQEAVLRAWRDLPKMRESDSFQGWLRRLVVKAVDEQHRAFGHRHDATQMEPRHDVGDADHVGAQFGRDVSTAFRQLSPEERTVIGLCFYLDLAPADAAATLGTREVTYRTRLQRAVRALERAAIAVDDRP